MQAFKTWGGLALLALGLASAAPAVQAQQSAKEVLTDILLARGMVREDIDQLVVFRGRALDLGWDMSLDQSFAIPVVVFDEGSTGLALALVRNAGQVATCARVKGDMRGESVFDKTLSTTNVLVAPGAAVPVVGSGLRIVGEEWDVEMDAGVAVWQAPPGATRDEQCNETQPELLNGWLAAPGFTHFADYARERLGLPAGPAR